MATTPTHCRNGAKAFRMALGLLINSSYTTISATTSATPVGKTSAHSMKRRIWYDSASPVVSSDVSATYPVVQGDLIIDSANHDLYVCTRTNMSASVAVFVQVSP